MLQYLVKFIETANLDFNLQVEALLLQISMATVDSIVDATGEIDMVIFQENHIKKTNAMVHTTTNLYSLLLQHAKTWSCLTGIKDMSLCTLKTLYILSSHGSNATHTLHDIEHQTLCLEQRTGLTLYNHCNVTLLNMGSILKQHFYLHGRIETGKYLLCHFNTCQHTIFLDKQVALTHGVFWDTTQGCVVAITDILSKCQVYQLVF